MSPFPSNPSILLRLTAAVLLIFLIGVLFFNAYLIGSLGVWTEWVLSFFGGYYLFLGLGSVLLMLLAGISPLGKIKLGAENPSLAGFRGLQCYIAQGWVAA